MLLVSLIVVVTLIPRPPISLSTPSVSLPATDYSLVSEADERGAGEAAVASPPATFPAATGVGASQAPSGTPVAATPPPIRSAGTPAALAIDPDTPPNELGRIPVIMYHAFTTNPKYLDEWTLTLDQFREQLDWYREHDFVMVGVQSMIDGRFDVPAGKKPIILTFDDASMGQFGLQKAPDGGWAVKPNTAVAVLEEYRAKYPEFAGPAFFGILSWNCFASDDDPSTCEERLNWLVDNGYEVGNHTWDHVDMTDVADEFFTNSIASMIDWINERIPEGPGNLSHVVVMPFGAFPDPDLHPDQRAWLAEGFWYQGEPVNLHLVFAVSGGPAISPFSQLYDPMETYRIASFPDILGSWQEAMTSGESQVFVSDGDPEVVTVPASMEQYVNVDALASRGLELRVYEEARGDG